MEKPEMQMKNMIAKWWRKFISSNWNSVSLLTLLTKMQNNWKLTANSNCKPNCCKNQECYQPYAVSCCPTHFRALEIWIILILFACVFTIRNAISSFGFYDWKKIRFVWEIPELKLWFISIEITMWAIFCWK